jgi:hypothetical protein
MPTIKIDTGPRTDIEVLKISAKEIKLKVNGNTVTITDFLQFRTVLKLIVERLRWW